VYQGACPRVEAVDRVTRSGCWRTPPAGTRVVVINAWRDPYYQQVRRAIVVKAQ
jgi:hypothetical protein